MEAYAAPFVAAGLAGLTTALALGLVRLLRLRRDRERPAAGPPPGAARDAALNAADPLPVRLSFRLLAVALFLGFCGLLLFAPDAAAAGAKGRPDLWTLLALLGAWVAGAAE